MRRIVIVLAAVLGAGCGPSKAERDAVRAADEASAARGKAEARASAAETEVADLRGRLAAAVKERDRARADLDLAKQSMIDLQAEARKSDEERFAAAERARLVAVEKARAEATAAARAREAETARAGLEDARARAEAAEAKASEPAAVPKGASGKAAAACVAIAKSIEFGGKELTDPLQVDSAYLEWLTGDGGWSSRDVADLGPWVREAWAAIAAGKSIDERRTSATSGETRDKGARMERAIADIKKAFLDGKPEVALKEFRYWRPRSD